MPKSIVFHRPTPAVASISTLLTLLYQLHGTVGHAAPASPAAASNAAPASIRGLLHDDNALASWLLLRNRDLAGARARVGQALADVGASRLWQNPSIDFMVSDIPVGAENSSFPAQGFSNSAIYTVGISQTLEIGKRGPRIAAAQLSADSSRSSYTDVFSQKLADARLALGRVAYLNAKRTIFDERLQAAKQILVMERSRLDHGYLSGNDYDRLLLDTLSFEAKVARNATEYEAALDACGAILFAPCSAEGAQAEDVETAAPLPALLPSTESVLRLRPDIQALSLAQQSALEDVRGARRRSIPDPTFRLGYMEDRLVAAGDQPHTLQVGLVLPIPAFNRGQYDAAKAKARADEYDSAVWSALKRAQADLMTLLKRRDYLVATLRTLTTEAVPRSSAVLESSLKAFHAGQISTTDLIIARKNHTSLLLNLMDLRFEYFAVRNELRRVLGLEADIARRASAAVR